MILFISGSINSGKSTVAQMLADRMRRTAVIEIDQLRRFIEWMPLEEAIPINLENTCLLIKNLVHHKMNVVVPYPLSQRNYEYIQSNLQDIAVPIFFYTLNPALEGVLLNRGQRTLTNWERQRIKHHYKTGMNQPQFGITIDNTKQTPAETVDEIMRCNSMLSIRYKTV